ADWPGRHGVTCARPGVYLCQHRQQVYPATARRTVGKERAMLDQREPIRVAQDGESQTKNTPRSSHQPRERVYLFVQAVTEDELLQEQAEAARADLEVQVVDADQEPPAPWQTEQVQPPSRVYPLVLYRVLLGLLLLTLALTQRGSSTMVLTTFSR